KIWATSRNIAKGAGAGADGAEDHHRRVLFLPALVDIRARRLLAHRVQVELAHQPARRVILRRARRLDADPRRFARARGVRPRRFFRMAKNNVASHGSPIALLYEFDKFDLLK